METTITKVFEFEAAHKLPDHPGACKNLHGHTYRLEVTVGAKWLNDQSMIMDFGDLKKVVQKNILDKWDHSYLNDVVDFVPTVESLADSASILISDALRRRVSDKVYLVKIRLWETSTSYAEVY